MKKKFSYKLEWAGIRVLGALATALGPGARVSVGSLLGRLALTFVPRLKSIARGNMRRAYPEWSEAQVDRLLGANAAHMGRMAFEFLAAQKMSVEEFRSLIRVENREIVDSAREEGKGVIILAIHIGNWEYHAMALSSVLDLPIHAVGKRVHNPYVNEMVITNRERFGTRALNNRNAARPVLKLLKNGEFAGMLMDQRPGKSEGVSSTFFGQTVATNHGLATLALRSGAPVVFTTCLSDGDGYVVSFRGRIEPPPDTGDREARILEFTRAVDRAIEELIRERPAEWLWMHNRWKLPKGFKP